MAPEEYDKSHIDCLHYMKNYCLRMNKGTVLTGKYSTELSFVIVGGFCNIFAVWAMESCNT
jgi:hypothetical protein